MQTDITLSKISEVKNYFTDHKKQMEEQYKKWSANRSEDAPGSAYLFGNRSGEADEVRAAFPQKHICDKLITLYFNGFDPALRKFPSKKTNDANSPLT